MAFTSSPTLENQTNSNWTREQRIIEKVRTNQKSGIVLDQGELTDLLGILQAVDDYMKGNPGTMITILNTYNTSIANLASGQQGHK